MSTLKQSRSDLSGAYPWAVDMETLGCPVIRVPLSAALVGSKGVLSTNVAAGAARGASIGLPIHSRGSTLDFYRVYSVTLSSP